ncbi:MAG: FkbM family methyltransferase [Gammaproteobacteria bacterium AqS3]|nr:FkbM family methyltransferase [Gammaproteobacteria bacterium AqS3]
MTPSSDSSGERAHQGFRHRFWEWFFDRPRVRRNLWKHLRRDFAAVTLRRPDYLFTLDVADHWSKKMFFRPDWQRSTVNHLVDRLREMNLLEPGKTVLELGAHIGSHTIYLHSTGAFAGAIAVEPHPDNFALLRHNMVQNGLDSATSCLNVAVDEQEGRAEFFSYGNGFSAQGSLQPRLDGEQPTASHWVETCTVSSILSRAETDAADISLVHIDVEGVEYRVLPGVFHALGPRVPVFTEFFPGLYGLERAGEMLDWIGSHYASCIRFAAEVAPTGDETVMSPKQMAEGLDFSNPEDLWFDLLLFNP